MRPSRRRAPSEVLAEAVESAAMAMRPRPRPRHYPHTRTCSRARAARVPSRRTQAG
ncbi:hypothetical protein ACFXDJ_31330 [Streptomyces sp. NPDC059443]|uniref:hypothetical protein n=1 Tax=unclassified Streptomyces TaxID=2593676 RepID=UPI003681F820